MPAFEQNMQAALGTMGDATPENATLRELYTATSAAAMQQARENWRWPSARPQGGAPGKTACYFSAEFLLGRMVYANLLNLGLLEEMQATFARHGLNPAMFEEVEDAALGNGGLGRLAAGFLDSAATQNLRVDGYGIRYKYGLFKQYFENGFQKEEADDWQRFGDPWSVRRDDERVQVDFGDQSVWAVPYDMPVIGYGGQTVNNLRLWEAQPLHAFDFGLFNTQQYDEAYKQRNDAEALHSVLYPNDDGDAGKRLRLKQQYFFASASLQSMLRQFTARYGEDWDRLPEAFAVQLNDTHPTVAIPELLRLLMKDEAMDFARAAAIAQKVFAYTNHTIMAEALEAWDVRMFGQTLPEVYPYVVLLNNALRRELAGKGISGAAFEQYAIVAGGRVHMARMAIYATHSTNGVAALHTEILKYDALKEWYTLYPARFNNKTNGITQRRWLALCNPELASFITARIGSGWITDLDELEKLRPYADDAAAVAEFAALKTAKKRELVAHIAAVEGVHLSADSAFDIQIKRLHEYKRQLLNAFSILDIYYQIKAGQLAHLPPVTFLFGAKAAPGYRRAKAIIKYINEIAKLIDGDPDVRDKMRVLFVQNYNVSYAEKLIPAADISEQISTAGTEASGTGNMKLMLNGAVTLGTFDGANVEIVEQAGEANNYIFGARVQELRAVAPEYSPKQLCSENPRIRRVVESLVDGTFYDEGTGMFADLHRSLIRGESWHRPDVYYLLLDFEAYTDTKIRALRDYAEDKTAFARKCLLNIAAAGKFSSDRTIREYATDIWGL